MRKAVQSAEFGHLELLLTKFRSQLIAAGLALLLAANTQALNGQVTTGAISGVVTDLTGAVMPGVSVTARHQQTGVSQSAATDDGGRYRFAGLSTGSYELSFAREGFETASQTFRLNTESAVLDVTLAVSAVSTTVVVREAGGTVTDIAGKTTASRLNVPDIDLPVQVSSVPLQVIEVQGANNMATALRNVSGVSATVRYGMYEYYTIRGFNNDIGPETFGNVVLVDGLRLEGNRTSTQLNNVEQIDVLKGPSSILYGGQAFAGAINIIRKKPQTERLYELMYRGGRFNTHQVAGGATGPVMADRLLYRLDMSYDHSDAWRDAGARRLNASPTLTWLLNDNSRLTIRQTFNHDTFDGDAGVPVGVLSLPNFDLSRRFNTPQDFEKSRDSQTQILLNIGIGENLQFRNSFFHRRANDEYFTAEFLDYLPDENQVFRESLYFKHHLRPVQDQADVTGSFNLFGMRHTFVTGYEYWEFSNRTNRSASRSVEAPTIDLATFDETYVSDPDFPLSRVDHLSSRIHALFWQDQIALTSRLKVNVGGRFDDYHRSRHRDPWADGQRVSRGPEQTREQTAYTYRAGLVYYLTGSQQVYFGSSSSFQPVSAFPADGRELKPETGQSFEIGHRWQGLNGRFVVDTAFYRIPRNDVVISLPHDQFDQAGQQSSKGIDFDVNGDLGRGVRLIANYGYSLPRFDEYFESEREVDLSGFRPAYVPLHSSNIWITKIWNSGISASLGSRYQGPMYTNNANTIRIGGWTTFGGAVGFKRDFYEWSLNAENLFNRERYFTASDYDNQVYPGPPINVFTTFRFRFR
jgi:iron complex outermembrane recepter protein